MSFILLVLLFLYISSNFTIVQDILTISFEDVIICILGRLGLDSVAIVMQDSFCFYLFDDGDDLFLL